MIQTNSLLGTWFRLHHHVLGWLRLHLHVLDWFRPVFSEPLFHGSSDFFKFSRGQPLAVPVLVQGQERSSWQQPVGWPAGDVRGLTARRGDVERSDNQIDRPCGIDFRLQVHEYWD